MVSVIKIHGEDFVNITGPAGIQDAVAFNVDFQCEDAEAVLDVAYTATTATVTIRDVNQAIAYTGTPVAVTAGVGQDAGITIDTAVNPGPFDITVTLDQTEDVIKSTTGRAYQPTGETNVIENVNKLVWLLQPITNQAITRAVKFTLQIQAQDGFSVPITTATDTVNLALTLGDGSDVIKDGGITITSVVLDGINGQFTSNDITIEDGAGNDDTQITGSNASYISAVSNTFKVSDATTPVASVIHDRYPAFSYFLEPGGFSDAGGTDDSPGMISEFSEARSPIQDGVFIFSGPVGAGPPVATGFLSLFQDRRTAGQTISGSPETVVSMDRCFMKFDITAVKATAISASLRITSNPTWTFTGTPNLNANLANINIYADTTDIAGAADFNKFNDILTRAIPAKFQSQMTVQQADDDFAASGFVEFGLDVTQITGSPDTFLRLFMLLDRDVDNNPFAFQGASTSPAPTFTMTSGAAELRVIV